MTYPFGADIVHLARRNKQLAEDLVKNAGPPGPQGPPGPAGPQGPPGTSGGIAEAPEDGTTYGRYNATWIQVLPIAGGTMRGPLVTATVGFNGTAAINKPTVTGSRGGNAALASLITALAAYGLVTDSTTT